MFDGVRVLEIGTWVMVPAAGVILADYGAEVIKVEHTRAGDPARGLVTGGISPMQGQVNMMVEQVNRGKRSLGLDISTDDGRAVLHDLIERSDVFVTNFLPAAREKLGIDVDAVRAINPAIVYAMADAVGPDGPEGGKPGYDSAVFFGRAGILNSLASEGPDIPQPRPGFGDKTAALSIAFGIASALYRRERTGAASVVDVSLLGSALWVASSDIVYSLRIGSDFARRERPATNPIATRYATADGRWVMLAMLESQRWWPSLCQALEHQELIADSRFADAASRADNAHTCRAILAGIFASATLAEWRTRLAPLAAPWETVADSFEAGEDPQATANGYVADVQHPSGETIKVVRAPVSFDRDPPELGVAPEFAQHTEEVLLELGRTWEEIAILKASGAVP